MSETTASHLEVLRSCFDAIARGDASAVVEHYSHDYVLELPYADPQVPFRLEGREAVRAYLDEAFGVFRFTLTLCEQHPSGDPDLLILEYSGEGVALTSGRPYRNLYLGLWWFRGGEICRTREYYNPAAAALALEPAED